MLVFAHVSASAEHEKLYRSGPKQRHESSHKTDAAHAIMPSDVINKLLSFASARVRHTDKERLVRVLANSNKNTRVHPAKDVDSHTQTKADRELDREIRNAFV